MIKVITLTIFFVIAIVFAPFAFIWSINTLFPELAIAFTFKTWIAAAFLHFVVLYPQVNNRF